MDLRDHPFSPENIARECGASDTHEDRVFDRYVTDVEKLLGHTVDGNDVDYWTGGHPEGDGYSLDECSDMFDRGMSAKDYVDTVKKRERYKKPV